VPDVAPVGPSGQQPQIDPFPYEQSTSPPHSEAGYGNFDPYSHAPMQMPDARNYMASGGYPGYGMEGGYGVAAAGAGAGAAGVAGYERVLGKHESYERRTIGLKQREREHGAPYPCGSGEAARGPGGEGPQQDEHDWVWEPTLRFGPGTVRTVPRRVSGPGGPFEPPAGWRSEDFGRAERRREEHDLPAYRHG
jgi:hypothetical protein